MSGALQRHRTGEEFSARGLTSRIVHGTLCTSQYPRPEGSSRDEQQGLRDGISAATSGDGLGAPIRGGQQCSLTSDVPEGTGAGPFPLALLTAKAGGVGRRRAVASHGTWRSRRPPSGAL